MNTEDGDCFQVQCKLYELMWGECCNKETIIDFVNSYGNYIDSEMFFQLIFFFLNAGLHTRVMKSLALEYKDVFTIKKYGNFDFRVGNLWICKLHMEGIPCERFCDFEKSVFDKKNYLNELKSPIVESIKHRNFEGCDDCDVNEEFDGKTLIEWAALYSNPYVFDFMLRRGAKVDYRVIKTAALKGNYEIINEIIDYLNSIPLNDKRYLSACLDMKILVTELIRYHRNDILMSLYQNFSYDEKYQKIAEESYNFFAYCMFGNDDQRRMFEC